MYCTSPTYRFVVFLKAVCFPCFVFSVPINNIISTKVDSNTPFIVVVDQMFEPASIKRCFQTPHQGKVFYLKDDSDCMDKSNIIYTLAIQSERRPASSCQGLPSQSQQIEVDNDTGPVQLHFKKKSDAWSVSLIQDYKNHPHPCGKDVFNWYVLMAHRDHSKVELPGVVNLAQVLTYQYTDKLDGDGVRFLAGLQINWDKKTYLFEINLIARWHDAHPDEDIIFAKQWPNEHGLHITKYIMLDSLGMHKVGQSEKNRPQQVTIYWGRIFQNLIHRDILQIPVEGLQNSNVIAIFAGVEHKNELKTNSGISTLILDSMQAIDLKTNTVVFPTLEKNKMAIKTNNFKQTANKQRENICQKPKGYFRVKKTVYYSDLKKYCSFKNWQDYIKANNGSGDFSNYPIIDGEPYDCLRYSGVCLPEDILLYKDSQ